MRSGVLNKTKQWSVFTLFAFMLIAFQGRAQINPELFERLNKPIVDCKTVAFNSQEIITGFSNEQTDSIAIVLNAWEQLCGTSEPIMRLHILLDIKNGVFDEANYTAYMQNYFYKFEQRINSSDNPDYRNANSIYAVYLDFVPANGKFDLFTIQLAYSLKDLQPQNTMAYLYCVLFEGNITTFYTLYKAMKYADGNGYSYFYPGNQNYRESFEIYSFFGGVCFPMGQLQNSFNPSPFFGMDFGVQIKEKYRAALDFKVVPVSENSNILLHTTKDTATTITSIITIGLKFTRKNQLYRRFFADISVGAGVNSINTDLIKKPASGRSKEDTYYSLTTADFNGSIAVRYRFNRGQSLGFISEWHYAPYSWHKNATPSIGDQYLLTGLLFNF